ncbi:MAG: flagellar basal-body MS-ring/collar protein FliF [Nitrospiraceae bacterium]|nr:flagellar basal-body MS-ring/collar protein FliF [Nitrospiraceae bacterium]
MPKQIMDILEQLKGLPKGRQAAFFGGAVLLVAAIIVSFVWLQRPDYELLYSNLTDEDAGLIMQKLDQQKIPYKATSQGLMVPADKVAVLRLKLAAEGLPQSGGVGFEIFDKNSYTTTDFVQKVDYKRALQGELARTIMAISGIELCRVQLVIPDNSDFLSDKPGKPRASVLIKLAPGRALSQGQVQGIVHLVASSVEGLSPSDVSIVDSQGYILNAPEDESIVLTGSQLEYEHTVEKDIENRVSGILAPVVGPGNVKVRVAADIDFTKMDKIEKTYDPDSQVARSQQTTEEKSTTGAPGGVPGAASNLPGKPPVAAFSTQGQSEKKNETVNYEINEVTSHIENATGVVRRLSVVALVDGTYKNVKGKLQYIPRSDQDLKQFEDMVKKAVGYDAGRGDQVKVVNMPFNGGAEEELAAAHKPSVILPAAESALKRLSPLVFVILIFFFVIRPLVKALSRPGKHAPEAPQLPEEAMKLLEQAGGQKQIAAEKQTPESRVIGWARENPKDAAFMIKNWIEEK